MLVKIKCVKKYSANNTILLPLIFIFIIALTSNAQIKNGTWRGVLLLHKEENITLPFNFDYSNKNNTPIITIYNADEKIVINEIVTTKDSVFFKMPIFDSEFRLKINNDTLISGLWINYSRTTQNKIHFSAEYNKPYRFVTITDSVNSFYLGKWECTFSPDSKDSTKAIGLFKSANDTKKITGTFLTETGDYRFLEGTVLNNKLYLSCFDGSHAFLFIAENNGSSIVNGSFYSGSHWHEKWIAKRNKSFTLKNAETITTLKDTNAPIVFSFPNTEKIQVSLSDKKYQNKVVIIQIMGSWCPNCMDETSYLSTLHKQYNTKGLEIIGLAYERTNDFEKAKNNVTRLKKRFSVDYDILITGLTGKEKASESLPFLNKVSAFPTTIILDKIIR